MLTSAQLRGTKQATMYKTVIETFSLHSIQTITNVYNAKILLLLQLILFTQSAFMFQCLLLA